MCTIVLSEFIKLQERKLDNAEELTEQHLRQSIKLDCKYRLSKKLLSSLFLTHGIHRNDVISEALAIKY